ncbi:MAG TPA: DNA polymerase I [Candidatus Saccharimonadales bacterium]|nr:DNA polymerase I [Candidatus Saccharimonadales bacterium]
MTDSKQPKRFVIIDGKSVFYRGYYAMPNLSTKDGTPTGGVYGFAVMALEVIKRLKPDYVAIAWDKPKTNIRKRLAMYPEYKAGRKPAPPDFYEQIPVLHELLQAFGWPLYELDDYEADDIMGTLSTQATKKGIETLLISSDLDMLQLVDQHVHMYALKKGLSNIELYSPKSFEAKYGITVDQFLDLKALKGDASDNIPGVPGIGEKTATELLKEFKTLDNIYKNLELVKDSVRKKLEAGRELADLSKKLGAIWCDAPIKLDLKAVDGSNVQPATVLQLLQKLEFRTLARQLPEIMQVAISEHDAASPSTSLKVGKSEYINTKAKLTELKINNTEQLFVHSFCAGKHGRRPLIMALSSDGKNTYTLDLAALSQEDVVKALSKITTTKTKLIGYDVKATLKVLLELGIEVPLVEHDVLIGAFLLNSLRREQSLTELATADLGYEGAGFENLDPKQLIGSEPEIIAIIAALYEQQAMALQAIPKLLKLAQEIEWPVIPVLARMEWVGIELDTSYLKKFSVEIDDAISDLEQQIYGYADEQFNIGSPAQLADILFSKLHLALSTQGIKKGKTGYSTAASELDKLRGTHPIIDLISLYREVTKLKSTYVDALPKLVDEHSRLHTNFKLTIAQTGRLSSTDPNLQNIPVRTDLGRRIRTAFVAGKDKALVSADYSQFELRIAAYLSNDKTLIEQFNRDVDVHTITAAQIYDREPEDVTKNMRREAKVVNFGVMYGLSAHGLVIATGMSYEQAQHFIKRYFEVRPKLLSFIESVKEQARKDGYTATLFGRRRPTPDINSSNFAVREAAMRAAVNMPFQGTAADIMKLAMTAVDKKLHTGFPEANVLLQIHDSLIVECNRKDSQQVAELLKTTMEQAYKLPVKLTVDTSIGQNWGEL